MDDVVVDERDDDLCVVTNGNEKVKNDNAQPFCSRSNSDTNNMIDNILGCQIV